MATDSRSHNLQGAEIRSRSQDGESQRGRGRSKQEQQQQQLETHLQIPKNRSTGNLAVVAEGAEAASDQRSPRFRFSFDAVGSAAGSLDYDSITRYVDVDLPACHMSNCQL